MNQHSKLIVISDLHLWGPEDPLYRGLLRLLDEQLSSGDKLFIVGDLFDLYVGHKTVFSQRYKSLLDKLKLLGSKNVEVFYIEGNHDFQLEDLFFDAPHIKLYSDELHYEWDGKKIFFSHGDKINLKDYKYLFFRALTRNLIGQCLIDGIPGEVLDKLGTKMAKISRNYHPTRNESVVRMFRNFACEKIAQGYNIVVLGHSHCLDQIRFRVDLHEGQFVNVGFPRKDKKFLILNQGTDFFEFKDWNLL